jgi:hypothetical protein
MNKFIWTTKKIIPRKSGLTFAGTAASATIGPDELASNREAWQLYRQNQRRLPVKHDPKFTIPKINRHGHGLWPADADDAPPPAPVKQKGSSKKPDGVANSKKNR